MSEREKKDFSASDILNGPHRRMFLKVIANLEKRTGSDRIFNKLHTGETVRIVVRIEDVEVSVYELFEDMLSYYDEEVEAVARDMVAEIFEGFGRKLDDIAEKTQSNIIEVWRKAGHLWDYES